MPSSLGKKLCAGLLLASGLIGATVASSEEQQQQINYVRSAKHSRRAAQQLEERNNSEAGPSSLAKRGPTYNGRATFYAAGLGACGNYNSPSDFIVALNAAQYGNMGQVSSWCGKTIAITYQGNTQYATVQDACPGCPYGGLDMSEDCSKLLRARMWVSFTCLGLLLMGLVVATTTTTTTTITITTTTTTVVTTGGLPPHRQVHQLGLPSQRPQQRGKHLQRRGRLLLLLPPRRHRTTLLPRLRPKQSPLLRLLPRHRRRLRARLLPLPLPQLVQRAQIRRRTTSIALP